MAALTADRNTPYRDGELVSFPVKGGAFRTIYVGAIVVSDAGYAKPGVKEVNKIYLGRAEEQVRVFSGDADGDKNVLVRLGRAFKWDNAPGGDAITQADIGKTPYIFDDQTVTAVATDATPMTGLIILSVDADGVWVG